MKDDVRVVQIPRTEAPASTTTSDSTDRLSFRVNWISYLKNLGSADLFVGLDAPWDDDGGRIVLEPGQAIEDLRIEGGISYISARGDGAAVDFHAVGKWGPEPASASDVQDLRAELVAARRRMEQQSTALGSALQELATSIEGAVRGR